MAAKKTLTQLKSAGKKAGLSADQVAELNELFGSDIAHLLITLKSKRGGLKVKRLEMPKFSLDSVKQLLIDILTEHHDDILGWISTGENVVLSAVAGLLAARSPALIAVLMQYKDRIMNEADALTIDTLDQLIAILQGKSE